MPESKLMQAARTGKNFPPDSQVDEDLGKRDEYGWTALMYAAQNGHLNVVKRLIPGEVKIQDSMDRTALMHAASNGKELIVKELVSHESRICEHMGKTALMLAAKKKDLAVCTILAPEEAGCQDQMGWTALMYVLDRRYNDLGQSSLDVDDEEVQKMVSLCNLLVPTEAGKVTLTGMTALMLAAEIGNVDVCRLLVGAEAGLSDDAGVTALMLAAQCGNNHIVGMLLEKEAGILTPAGKTALMYAAEFGHYECCKLLLPSEGTIHSKTRVTALMHAASGGHTNIVKLLMQIQQGIVSNTGLTAYLCAEEAGYPECAELLRQVEATTAICSLISTSYVGKPMKLSQAEAMIDRSLLLNDLTRTQFRNTGAYDVAEGLRHELLEKERAVATLTQQLKKQLLLNARLNNLIDTRDAEIVVLHEELEEKNEIITELTISVDDLSAQLTKAHETNSSAINFAENDVIVARLPLSEPNFKNLQMDQIEKIEKGLLTSLDCAKMAKAELTLGPPASRCAVCLGNPAVVFYLPCQHMVVCAECNRRLANNRCPVCRTVITESFIAYVN